MKFVYTDPITKELLIVVGCPKSEIEDNIGKITDEQYEKLVRDTCNQQANDIEKIENIPETFKDFGGAHFHKGKGVLGIDICRAKEIQLSKFRKLRNELLDISDKKMNQYIDEENENELKKLRSYRKKLRESTEPLKNFQISNQYDESLLASIIKLGDLDKLSNLWLDFQ